MRGRAARHICDQDGQGHRDRQSQLDAEEDRRPPTPRGRRRTPTRLVCQMLRSRDDLDEAPRDEQQHPGQRRQRNRARLPGERRKSRAPEPRRRRARAWCAPPRVASPWCAPGRRSPGWCRAVQSTTFAIPTPTKSRLRSSAHADLVGRRARGGGALAHDHHHQSQRRRDDDAPVVQRRTRTVASGAAPRSPSRVLGRRGDPVRAATRRRLPHITAARAQGRRGLIFSPTTMTTSVARARAERPRAHVPELMAQRRETLHHRVTARTSRPGRGEVGAPR